MTAEQTTMENKRLWLQFFDAHSDKFITPDASASAAAMKRPNPGLSNPGFSNPGLSKKVGEQEAQPLTSGMRPVRGGLFL